MEDRIGCQPYGAWLLSSWNLSLIYSITETPPSIKLLPQELQQKGATSGSDLVWVHQTEYAFHVSSSYSYSLPSWSTSFRRFETYSLHVLLTHDDEQGFRESLRSRLCEKSLLRIVHLCTDIRMKTTSTFDQASSVFVSVGRTQPETCNDRLQLQKRIACH